VRDLEEELEEKRATTSELQQELNAANAALTATNETLTTTKQRCVVWVGCCWWQPLAKAKGLTQHTRAEHSLVEVESMLETLQASPVVPHKEIERLQEQLEGSWRARTWEQKALRDCSDERDIKEEENARLRKELKSAEAALATYRTRFQEEYKERRRLHNIVMVRLASVRVWPMRHTAGRVCMC